MIAMHAPDGFLEAPVALVIAVISGVIPKEAVFSGFGHPAVIIIALVLIVSAGLNRSGAIEILARRIVDSSRSLGAHVGIMAGISAALSAVMNNVAALALLMPTDIQAAQRAKRSPALTLMPISFASILGGMVTLIGTPPNIVIAEYRGDALGETHRLRNRRPLSHRLGGSVPASGRGPPVGETKLLEDGARDGRAEQRLCAEELRESGDLARAVELAKAQVAANDIRAGSRGDDYVVGRLKA